MTNSIQATIILPLPPSINTYWRNARGHTYIAPTGRQFRSEVLDVVKRSKITTFGDARLEMSVVLHFRDRRQSDIDNRIKALWDALEHAGVYDNDSQIDTLVVSRGSIEKGGKCVVTIRESI